MFQTLRETLAGAGERFRDMARTLALLDFWQSLATAARKWDWTRPALDDSLDLHIKAGRHPVVEAAVGGAAYIPNDLDLDGERRLLIITGPNMAGKSTVLRQAALLVILAQMGSFVPARQARIGLADRVFSRVGASDNLAQGQSTFMVEMTETARIIRQAGKRSLVILDEIGRGTSTFDGLSIAWAVVEELARRGEGGIRTLFATHYHELTSLEGTIPGVRNMNIAVKEWKGEIIFLRRLVPGPSDRSYGIEVARLAGVPQPVVVRAKEVLADLERRARGSSRQELPSVRLRQSLLPGFALDASGDAPVEAPSGPHPLQAALLELSLDELTPLDALKLLHAWKKDYGQQGE
jgi:DNA mismatch repair protein MutS